MSAKKPPKTPPPKTSDSASESGADLHPLTLERLREETFQGFWRDLQPHQERGAIFMVSPDLDVAEVGLAVARDEAQTVATWVKNGDLTRPRPDQVIAWDQNPTHQFRFIIVAPYVLIQDLAN